MAWETVLIVDDFSDWRRKLSSILAEAGFNCETAGDFTSAIRLLQTLEPVALVLDMELQPGTESQSDYQGWALARQAQVQGVASVIVSAHAKDGLWSRAFREFGAIDLFDKWDLAKQVPDFVQRVAEAVAITKQRRDKQRGRIVQPVHLQQVGDEEKLYIDTRLFPNIRADFTPPLEAPILGLLLALISEGRASWSYLTAQERQSLADAGLSEDENPEAELLEQVGMKLYDAITPGKAGTALHVTLQDARSVGASLVLQLWLDQKAPDLVGYPWELIHDGSLFLAQGGVSLSRHIACSAAIPPLEMSFPLRVLAVVPRPIDQQPQLPDAEEGQIREAVNQAKSGKNLLLERLEPPVSYERMTARLNSAVRATTPFHVLYYDGHGDFSWHCSDCHAVNAAASGTCSTPGCTGRPSRPGSYKGHLVLEDEARCSVRIDADQLATALRGSGVQLAVFSACDTAQVYGRTISNSIGPRLIEEGIPAVVAMQFPIGSTDTLPFFREFFVGLTASRAPDGAAIEDAVRDARKLVTSERWFYPVLYLRGHTTVEGG